MTTPIKTWSKALKSQYLQCRDLQHSWEPATARRVPKGFERELVCKCGTVKTQTLSKTGAILQSRVAYPKDYLRPAGQGRVTKSEKAMLRLTAMGVA